MTMNYGWLLELLTWQGRIVWTLNESPAPDGTTITYETSLARNGDDWMALPGPAEAVTVPGSGLVSVAWRTMGTLGEGRFAVALDIVDGGRRITLTSNAKRIAGEHEDGLLGTWIAVSNAIEGTSPKSTLTRALSQLLRPAD
jgi:hypothetical protein